MSVLICDMVGSTEVRVRLGAEGERLVRLQETLAREAVQAHGGTVVKGLGDGAMAVFDAAADAVAAAVRIQRSLEALHRRGEADALHVRVGVSAGDVAVGVEDCYGLPVAEAVRLCAEAKAGEILVADVVRALGRHGLEVPLSPAGDFDLRGLREPVTAWRAEWRPVGGGWSEFPMPARLVAPLTAGFVGRTSELATLLPNALAHDDRRLLLVTGEAGVGKSALAAELARRVNEACGAIVLHGSCDEELRPPYQPFLHALRHLVRHAPASTLEGYVRRHGGDLSVLVPDLVDRLGRIPAPRTTAEAADRYLLFTAVTTLLEDVGAETPVVLVLDDLHWADRGTLLLLRHVITATELPGLVVIATMRHGEVDDSNGLDDLLAELHRYAGVHRLDLSGLPGDELTELAMRFLHADRDTITAIARTIHRETEGNPFFATQLLRHLNESGPLDPSTPALSDLPPSVREVVRRRVRRLGDDVLRLLSTASVLGVEFHLEALADLTGMHPDTTLDLVETAVDAAVLREVPGRSRFRFAHALVQHTLYDDLSATRRRRLHRAAAETQERVGPASTSATHWLAAGDLADPLRAVGACTAAADEALLARAPDEAVKWYAAALDLTGVSHDRELTCELQLRLGEAQRLAGDPAHRVTLAQAAGLARQLGDAQRMARAALAKTRWFSSSVGYPNPEQVALLEAALEAVGPEPSATRARLLATLVAELVYTERGHERFALADEALAIARLTGDPDALFEVLFWRNTVVRSGHPESGNDSEIDELMRLAADGRDPLRQAMADLIVVLRSLENGRPHRSDEAMARATALAEELRLPVVQWLVTVLRGTKSILAGGITDAEKLAIEALELSQATDQPDASTWFGVQLYMVRYEQGRLGDLVDMSHAAIARAPRLYTWHAALVMALTEIGRCDEAQPIVDELLTIDYPSRRGEPHWHIGMSCLGSAVAALGDAAGAQRVYEALLPSAGRWASIMPLSLGSLDRVLGELALALGNGDDALRHFEAAIVAHDAAPAPSFAARSRIGLMYALDATDGDGARVRQLRDEVVAILDRHELPRVSALLAEAETRLPQLTLPAYPDDVQGQSLALLHVDET